VPANAQGEIIVGGIEAQTRGGDGQHPRRPGAGRRRLDDVCKCTVWLQDARDFGAFNRIYMSYFPGGKPARSTTEARLMVDARGWRSTWWLTSLWLETEPPLCSTRWACRHPLQGAAAPGRGAPATAIAGAACAGRPLGSLGLRAAGGAQRHELLGRLPRHARRQLELEQPASIGPFHSGTRRVSFRRRRPGSLRSG
jgi:hypothetical protein